MSAAVVLLACAQARAQVGLSLSAEGGTVGEELTVVIGSKRPAGVGALEVELCWPAASMELLDVRAGEQLGNALVDYKVIEPGRARCSFVSSGSVTSSGGLFEADFMPTAAGTAQMRLEHGAAWDYENVLEMLVLPAQGEIAIAPASPGTTTVLPGAADVPTGLYVALAGVTVIVLASIAAIVLRSRPRPA